MAPATDRNGELVHRFSLQMENLGFQRMADEIIRMLDSGIWQQWKDGLGRVQLQPGEFDYFLSSCGITRDDIMHGIRDMAIKARLEEAMDERRTGEDGYRRRYEQIKPALGRRNVTPFGYTKAERETLNGKAFQKSPKRREALGASVRRYAATGTTKAPSQQRSKVRQLEASIGRLNSREFDKLAAWFTDEKRRRQRARRK